MPSPILIVSGAKLRPLESVPRVGRLVCNVSKSTAYRLAKRDDWPLTPSGKVVVVPLLQRLGVPHTFGPGCPTELPSGDSK